MDFAEMAVPWTLSSQSPHPLEGARTISLALNKAYRVAFSKFSLLKFVTLA